MEAFREVKLPLSQENLTPISEENFQEVQQISSGNYTYQEVKETLEKNGISIENIFIANKGLYPFWYVNGFVYAPITSLTPSLIELAWGNNNIQSTKTRLERYWEKGEYLTLFAQIESQFGFDLFFTHLHDIPEDKQYEIFRQLYTRNEYGFRDLDKEKLRKIFLSNKNKSFRDLLNADVEGYVTIYRGMQEDSTSPNEAYSWTVDFEVAKRFALRFNSTECKIVKAKVHIDDVVDYIADGNIGDRGEQEILVLPETLKDIEDLGFYNLNQNMFKELEDEGYIDIYHDFVQNNLKGKWFHKPDGIHGKRHIKRVLFLSLLMSYLDDLPSNDRLILIYASLYHDIGRTHDYEDEGHGMKSVLKMDKLKLSIKGLDKEEVRILKFVMKYHSIRDEVGMNKIEQEHGIQNKERAIDLFKRFKDCDGIDRVRLGDLDIRYLRTETGKKMMFAGYQLLRNLK